MLLFFDFLYYSAYKIYRKFKTDGLEFSATLAISALQAFNIYSAILIYGIVAKKNHFPKLIMLGILGGLIIVNYIRYIQIDRFSIESIKIKWDSKTINYQRNNQLVQQLYLIFSILVFFSLVLYQGIKKME